MKKTLLSAVSILALGAIGTAATSGYAHAEAGVKTGSSVSVDAQHSEKAGEGDIEKGWENTKKAVSDAAEDVSDATQNVYEDVKAAFIDDDPNTEITTVAINMNKTANGMIGKTLYNGNKEAVGTVHDIILDRDGNARMIVISDGEILGLGKQVAFDYNVITRQNADGDVIAPITEAMIDQAIEFSYDRNDAADKVHVMPANGYSVNTLLNGQLVNQKGETVAEIDNIAFSNAKAGTLIIKFDQIMGFGGDTAAMRFDSTALIPDGTGYDVKLNAKQEAEFNAYKKAVN